MRVRIGLQRLEEAGVLEQVHSEGLDQLIALSEWQDRAILDIVSQIDTHCELKRDLLTQMIGYAEEKKRCRRNEILRYFGESPAPHARAECCDVCDDRCEKLSLFADIQETTNKKSAPPPEIEDAILACVRELGSLRSEEELLSVLNGTVKGYSRLKDSTNYGRLSHCSPRKIKQHIHKLISENQLVIDSDGRLST